MGIQNGKRLESLLKIVGKSTRCIFILLQIFITFMLESDFIVPLQDFEGQKKAERLFQAIIIVFAVSIHHECIHIAPDKEE